MEMDFNCSMLKKMFKRRMASRLGEVILPLCSDKTSLGVLCPALKPSTQDIRGCVGAGPGENHKDDWGPGTPFL